MLNWINWYIFSENRLYGWKVIEQCVLVEVPVGGYFRDNCPLAVLCKVLKKSTWVKVVVCKEATWVKVEVAKNKPTGVKVEI
jgi:hypothetical protein